MIKKPIELCEYRVVGKDGSRVCGGAVSGGAWQTKEDGNTRTGNTKTQKIFGSRGEEVLKKVGGGIEVV